MTFTLDTDGASPDAPSSPPHSPSAPAPTQRDAHRVVESVPGTDADVASVPAQSDAAAPGLALAMIVKNEEARLRVTLDSVTRHVDRVIVRDTGSTDGTLQVLQDYAIETGVPVHVTRAQFTDFSTDRNALLEYADTYEDIEYVLLLDSNDELVGGQALRKFVADERCREHARDPMSLDPLPCQAYMVRQKLVNGDQCSTFYNIRLLRSRCGWRYTGRVHEYISAVRTTAEAQARAEGQCQGDGPRRRAPSDVVIYQDRAHDLDKSAARYARDKDLLLADHAERPECTRTMFYLAQTCACLGQAVDAYAYYRMRAHAHGGFWEERFHALLRCGVLSEALGKPWKDSMQWYLDAMELQPRVEPLIHLGRHYRQLAQWHMAYAYLHLATTLTYPHECILFVDALAYQYTRWHMLGVVAYYAGQYRDGRRACEKAIDAPGLDTAVDRRNLYFYEQRMHNEGIGYSPYTSPSARRAGADEGRASANVPKHVFVRNTCLMLAREYPCMSHKEVAGLAHKLWKHKDKK